MSPIEQRVLAYLDQRGPTHRTNVVCDLASPESRIGRNGGRHNGSNGATPMIMAKWCKGLVTSGFVREVRESRTSHYRHHEITDAGRAALRTTPRSDDARSDVEGVTLLSPEQAGVVDVHQPRPDVGDE